MNRPGIAIEAMIQFARAWAERTPSKPFTYSRGFVSGISESADDELARLRRMADAYAKEQAGDWRLKCGECFTLLSRDKLHDHDCDVAAHLGLPREKGEGE